MSTQKKSVESKVDADTRFRLEGENVTARAHRLADSIRNGEIEVAQARVLCKLLSVEVKEIEIDYEHAKFTGRLQQGSAELPGLARVPAHLAGVRTALAAPASANGKSKRARA